MKECGWVAVGMERRVPLEETGEIGRGALGGGHARAEIKVRQPPGCQLMNSRGVPSLIEI